MRKGRPTEEAPGMSISSILENNDIDINIDKAILENIDIDRKSLRNIDIDKEIIQNIDIIMEQNGCKIS